MIGLSLGLPHYMEYYMEYFWIIDGVVIEYDWEFSGALKDGVEILERNRGFSSWENHQTIAR